VLLPQLPLRMMPFSTMSQRVKAEQSRPLSWTVAIRRRATRACRDPYSARHPSSSENDSRASCVSVDGVRLSHGRCLRDSISAA